MKALDLLDDGFRRDSRIEYCALGAGDFDVVFDSFQRKMERGENVSAVVDEIKDDPRWKVFEEYMNLPLSVRLASPF